MCLQLRPLRNHFEAKPPSPTRIPGGLELLLTRKRTSHFPLNLLLPTDAEKIQDQDFPATLPPRLTVTGRIFSWTLSRRRRSFVASDMYPPTKKTDSQKRHRDHGNDGRVSAVNARRGFRTFTLRRALSRTGINPGRE